MLKIIAGVKIITGLRIITIKIRCEIYFESIMLNKYNKTIAGVRIITIKKATLSSSLNLITCTVTDYLGNPLTLIMAYNNWPCGT